MFILRLVLRVALFLVGLMFIFFPTPLHSFLPILFPTQGSGVHALIGFILIILSLNVTRFFLNPNVN